MALKLVQEIDASIRVRAHMNEAGELTLIVQVSAAYGVPVDKKADVPTCSVGFENRIPGELHQKVKAALEEVRVYTEAHCAPDLQRAIIVSRETALRLGEIKEA